MKAFKRIKAWIITPLLLFVIFALLVKLMPGERLLTESAYSFMTARSISFRWIKGGGEKQLAPFGQGQFLLGESAVAGFSIAYFNKNYHVTINLK